MKLVIDIDDKVYGLLKYFEDGLGLNDKKDNTDDVKTALMRAVLNGTPLDDIKAEIKGIELNGRIDEHTMFTRTAYQVKTMVLNIIDNHIGKGANE